MRISRFRDFISEDLAFTAQAPHGVPPDDDDIKALSKKLTNLNKRFMSINYGGCGAFAVCLYDAIESEFGVTPNILLQLHNRGGDNIRFLPNYKNVVELNSDGFGLNHVVLELNGWIMDSDGVRKRSDDWDIRGSSWDIHTIGIDQLRGWVDEEAGWNDTFDRGQIEKMRKSVSRVLQHVGKLCVKRHLSVKDADTAAAAAVDKAT